jgi:hypothetical protein
LLKVGVSLLRDIGGSFTRLLRNSLEEVLETSDKLVSIALDRIDSSFGIRDRKENKDGFNESPAVVAGCDQHNKDDNSAPLHTEDTSLAVEVLRSELSASETHVTRDFTVSRRLSEIISFSTLMLLHEGLNSSLGNFRKLGFTFGASHRSGFAEITDITLVIVLSASTGVTVNNSIEVLSVEALHIRLSSHVGHLLSEVAHISIVSTIIRSPGLIVRFLSTRSIGTLALRLMELSEIDINESSLGLLFTLFFFIYLELINAVNKELLGGASGFGNYVLYMDRMVRDLNSLPSFSIVPSKFKLVSRLTDFTGHNEGTMISNIIDVVAGVSRGECDSAVSRHV